MMMSRNSSLLMSATSASSPAQRQRAAIAHDEPRAALRSRRHARHDDGQLNGR